MDYNFRENFSEICDYDETTIEYLKASLKDGEFTSFKETGFYYWSISECYARMKDAENLYENHVIFAKHVRNSDPRYLFWTVLDAAQRFTLESGGYTDFWWSLYKNAVESNADGDCIWEEFFAHLTALMTSPGIPCDMEKAEYALSAYLRFLKRTSDYECHSFFAAMYKLFSCRIYRKSLPRPFAFYKKYLFDVPEFYHPDEEFITGEWERFSSPPTIERQARTFLKYAINTAINNGFTDDAYRLYYVAFDFGLPRNDYIEKRLGNNFDP